VGDRAGAHRTGPAGATRPPAGGRGDEIRSLDDVVDGAADNGGLLGLDAEPGGDFPDLDAAGFEDTVAVAMAESVYLGALDGPAAAGGESPLDSGFVGDPGGFLEAIGRMAEPRLVGEADGIATLATTLEAPADLAEAFGGTFPDAEVELDVGADDLPTALRLDVTVGGSSASIEIELSGWNEPVEITVPGDDEVDLNPLVDEESLRRLTDLALVWPTDPPDGWELTVSSPMGTADCEEVELDWDRMTGDADYFWVAERPLDCALADDPTPFRPGGPGGLPSRESTRFGTVEVQVGDTAVEVDSTLDGADVDAVLRSLAPVDVETLISAVSGAAI
jgi:hypothetical protein